MRKRIAIYVRVSTGNQDTASQELDLTRWCELHADGVPVEWYRDTATGKTMDRPGWQRLEAALLQNEITSIVVWRLDRLGRTAAGLTKLFDQLRSADVNLVSLKDSLDLSTPAGRLMANVLASVAQYETEVRAERVRAGIARAKANGKQWGGSRQGRQHRVNQDKIDAIRQMAAQGKSIAAIARAVGLSRQWVYELIRREGLLPAGRVLAEPHDVVSTDVARRSHSDCSV
jgi:DNA invertase Pin-like site-specific DNA recombinase